MIKCSMMLMLENGPDGQPWDWRGKLLEWKKLGLQGVDIFHGMLTRVGETPKGIKAFG